MEIKRRLGKIQKALTPQIESMNVATEMTRMLDRFEELVRYAQEKIDRSAERKATLGKKAEEEKAAAQKKVEAAQEQESAANLKDQQESFDDRNKTKGDEDAGRESSQAK